MSNQSNYDYTAIENPYNDFLERSSSDGQGVFSEANKAGSSEPSTNKIEGKSVDGSHLNDIWLNTFIKSTNYKPLARGFMLDGKTGRLDARSLRTYDAIVDVNGNGDFTSIQEALNGGYNKLFIRRGAYPIYSDILISRSNVSITGEDESQTILTIYSTVSSSGISVSGTAGNNLSGIEIQNITLFGIANAKNGISISLTVESKINNCTITNFDKGVLFGGTCLRSSIVNCTMTNNNYDTYSAFNNSLYYITDNYFQSLSGAITVNLSFAAMSQSIISRNIINVYLNSGNKAVVIGNGVASSSKNNINNNLIYGDSTIASSNFITLNTNFNNSNISNNIFSNCGENVIDIVASSRNIISNNEIIESGIKTNNTYSSIILKSSSTYNIINGNNIYSSVTNKSKYGIREDSVNDNYNIISNNIVQGSVTANISKQGASSLEVNNIS